MAKKAFDVDTPGLVKILGNAVCPVFLSTPHLKALGNAGNWAM